MRKKKSGVSPVVGVILLVAITIIMGAVISQFIFDLTSQFSPTPRATVDFSQQLTDFNNETYKVSVLATQLDNADYLVVTTPRSSNITYDRIGATDKKPSDVDNAPNTGSDSQLADQGRVIIQSGDEVRIFGLKEGERVIVYGGIDGQESVVAEYTVQDVIPSSYK